MSEVIQRDYSFTVRLSQAEKAALEAFAARLHLDKSAALRHALKLAIMTPPGLAQVGQLVVIPRQDICLPVRLSSKVAHDG